MVRVIHVIVTTILILHVGGTPCKARTNSIEMNTYPDRNTDAAAGIAPVSLIARPAVHARLTEDFFFDHINGLLLKPGSRLVQQNLPLQETKLELNKSRKKGFILGASIGFVVGATLGYVGQKWACGYSEDDDCDISPGTIIGFGIIGTIPGAVIGVILGAKEFNAAQTGPIRTQVFYNKRSWILTRHLHF